MRIRGLFEALIAVRTANRFIIQRRNDGAQAASLRTILCRQCGASIGRRGAALMQPPEDAAASALPPHPPAPLPLVF